MSKAWNPDGTWVGHVPFEPGAMADFVVNGIAYVRTGLLNKQGHMVLRRLNPPVGFTADHSRSHYATDPEAEAGGA